ncbi:MAG: HAD family phosphatase, partial [Hyphomicrobiales bacterium]|nr:HAD family phosphatase [Hyphomicrobiales bacterium]
MISTVIFDLDGVLCRYDVPARLEVLSEITGRAPDDIHNDVWRSGFENDADVGRYPDPDEYLAAFARHLKFPISRAQWIDARRRSMTFFDGMLEIAKQLKATHQIAILTNNVPLLRETLPDIEPRLPELFGEHIYFSCDFRVGKPDPALYLKVADL